MFTIIYKSDLSIYIYNTQYYCVKGLILDNVYIHYSKPFSQMFIEPLMPVDAPISCFFSYRVIIWNFKIGAINNVLNVVSVIDTIVASNLKYQITRRYKNQRRGKCYI